VNAALFGAAIALGACLLFQIQFLLAKLVLPWFGGAAAVWSTCLVVFQVLLLAGYGYAHAVARRPRRTQVAVHGALIATALALLAWRGVMWPSPVTPGPGWAPAPGGSPEWQIVVLIVAIVGLPFLMLASTSPLLQHWFAERYPGRSPYRLYALSNLGSLIGLVSYPLLVEPRLDVYAQGRAWAWLCAACGMALLAVVASMRAVAVPVTVRGEPTGDDPGPPSRNDQLLWVALAAIPAASLQATTTRITQDIAAVPFLWMIPLAVYLLTFIVAFERPRWYRRTWLTLAVSLGAAAALTEWSTIPMLGLTVAELAAVGWCFHGELAQRAPAPAWLTRFYLLISAGGALGSAVVALGAPVAFDGIHEYPLTLAAAAFLLALVHALGYQPTAAIGQRRVALAASLLLAVLGGVLGGKTFVDWRTFTTDAVFTSRSFYGALRVREADFANGDRYRSLQHGTTMHGQQYLAADKIDQPTSYYTQTSGVGLALAALSTRPRAARIGVIGLGAGTLAAYGRPGDTFVFFEIDPEVVALSRGDRAWFTYLRRSPAHVEIVEGDARLSLQASSPRRFDVLAVDAFSGDAVPVHLLTREAFALYARHLADAQSVLAVHVSNRYLNLEGIVEAGGATAGLASVIVQDDLDDNHTSRSTWILLAQDPAALTTFGDLRPASSAAPWTDTASHLIGVLRR
jgi:spermidine synthase